MGRQRWWRRRGQSLYSIDAGNIVILQRLSWSMVSDPTGPTTVHFTLEIPFLYEAFFHHSSSAMSFWILDNIWVAPRFPGMGIARDGSQLFSYSDVVAKDRKRLH